MPIHFPEKIKMTNSHLEEVKYFMPALDLTKTKNGKNKFNQNHSNTNDNNTHNTKANTEDFTLNKKRNFDTDEWKSIMKAVGLTDEEMERFFKNKFISKLIDAIDNLICNVNEKADLIGKLQYDKSILNNQVAVYKKDNVTLTQNYLEIKNKFKALEEKIEKDNNNISNNLKDKAQKDGENDEENNALDSSLVNK